MEHLTKIVLILLLLTLYPFFAKAQNEVNLQPFSSFALLNPAILEAEKNVFFHTGNQFYAIDNTRSYSLLYANYSAPTRKMNGNFGISFSYGTVSHQNITTPAIGFSYSGFEKKLIGGSILFTANTKLSLTTKNWFAYVLDDLFLKKKGTPSLPGKKFTRYYIIQPGFGILCKLKSFKVGLFNSIPFQFSLLNNESKGYQKSKEIPLNLSFFIAKKVKRNKYGLKSRPFEVTPDFFIFYNKNFILSRTCIKLKHINTDYGFFVQNDFTHNIHSLGGSMSYKKNNLRFQLVGGHGIPGISKSTGFIGELSVSISIPETSYSKINPWTQLLK